MDRCAAAAMSAEAMFIPAVANDGTLYPVEKMHAHREGLLHLAISVFVFSRRGDLLIQRRAAGKYHSGGLWANTCCSHPRWGEGLAESARRRLREELGLDLPLAAAGRLDYCAEVSDGLVEWERVQAFSARINPDDAQLAPDPSEVSDVRWVGPAALRLEARLRPASFAPWFRIYLQRWDELDLQT